MNVQCRPDRLWLDTSTHTKYDTRTNHKRTIEQEVDTDVDGVILAGDIGHRPGGASETGGNLVVRGGK